MGKRSRPHLFGDHGLGYTDLWEPGERMRR